MVQLRQNSTVNIVICPPVRPLLLPDVLLEMV